jgi:hypothetical protein
MSHGIRICCSQFQKACAKVVPNTAHCPFGILSTSEQPTVGQNTPMCSCATKTCFGFDDENFRGRVCLSCSNGSAYPCRSSTNNDHVVFNPSAHRVNKVSGWGWEVPCVVDLGVVKMQKVGDSS